LDSNTWVSEVKRLRGKKQPLSSADLHALRDEYTRTIEPTRALAAETLTLERTLSDLINRAYNLTSAEIDLMNTGANRRLGFDLGAGFEGFCGFAVVLALSQMREHGVGPLGRADLHPRRNPLDRQGRFGPQPGRDGPKDEGWRMRLES